MNRLPDIVILDFCIWLSEKAKEKKSVGNDTSLIDMLSRDNLYTYAEEYVQDHRRSIYDGHLPVRALVEGFLSSEELCELENRAVNFYRSWRDLPSWIRDDYDTDIHSAGIYFILEESFHHYILRSLSQTKDINWSNQAFANYLARFTLDYLEENARLQLSKRPEQAVMQFMVQTQNEVADEIDFLDWILQNNLDDLSLENMPSEVFGKLLDKYIKETGKSEGERIKLQKAYIQTGWRKTLKRIRELFSFDWKRPERSLYNAVNRYLSRQAKFNCIILPLSNSVDRARFSNLIRDYWNDLNRMSRDYLDIYYSETDIGNTGYDIAEKLHSLPSNLRQSAPSIVVWKDNIAEAEIIPINDLEVSQIRNTIETIVQQISQGSELHTIVKEAKKTVKKEQELNRGVRKFIFRGDNNTIGDHNTISNTSVRGDKNVIYNGDYNQINNEFIKELDSAIDSINKSNEIKEESKKALISIMEEAKQAETENSDEKRTSAKKSFGNIKSLLSEHAPKLISTLANLTKIASFFGLVIK